MSHALRLATFAIALGAAMFATPCFAALEVGSKAPAFVAPAYLAGEPFTYKLATALKKGPVVVYFFPAPNTAGCNIEARLFSEAIDEFKAEGATVIGVTAGNLDQLAAFSKATETCGGKFPVAADAGAKIARQYDAILERKPEWASRTSYVIASDGSIAHAYAEMSPQLHVKQTLDAVKALKK